MSDYLETVRQALEEWYEAEAGFEGLILDYEQVIYDAVRWLVETGQRVDTCLTHRVTSEVIGDDECLQARLMAAEGRFAGAECVIVSKFLSDVVDAG